MAETLPMLALSPTMENGVIVKWHAAKGDTVAEGDVLCEVETDKAVMEYTSTAVGTLLQVNVQEGEQATVGQTICIIGEAGEDISGLKDEATTPSEVAASSTKKAAATAIVDPPPTLPKVPSSGGKIKSTPIARKLAEKHGLDITRVQGSGPGGRITKRDVQKAVSGSARRIASAPGVVLEEEDMEAVLLPVSTRRRIIAQRLSESKYSSPHFYMKLTAIMDRILQSRKDLNKKLDLKVSFNSFLIKFAATSLKRHPMVNSSWTEDNIIKHGRIDIGLAVALKDGLITPVIRDCYHKGILQIDQELKDLINKAREDRLAPADYQNSTFTISNLGSFGIEEFSAIINPPNSAILAVGKAVRLPMVDEKDEISIKSTMTLTLSCDHRVIDGTVGAAFLTDLKNMLEFPIQSLY